MWPVERMGNDNHFSVRYKLCGSKGHVGRRVVLMKEQVMVAPEFQSFSSHIFSQVSQNITVKVIVDHNVRRKKFAVNDPLYIEKTCRVFFALGVLLHCLWIITVNSTFVTRYDPKDKSWVLSLLS
jgi:hypothetical protein